MRRHATLLPICLALIGCLDAKRGGTPDDDATPATPDTTSQATAETTPEVGPSEIVDPCFGISCNDDDPCTVDLCVDGECVYSQVQRLDTPGPGEPPECDTDADCDDSDTSTLDLCRHRLDECGVSTWAYCEHLKPSPCNDNDVDCGDGDPCTLDSCDTTLGCVHEVIGEGICDSRCAAERSVDLLSLVSAAPPVAGTITTRGTAFPWRRHACDNDAKCHYPMGLLDANAELLLMGDDTPVCIEDLEATPTPTLSCEPLLDGVRYLVWGTPIASGATIDGLDFQGFCLDTRADAIIGHYAATFEVEGEPLVKFDATIEASSAGHRMVITNVRDMDLVIRLDLAAFAEQRPYVIDGFSAEGRVRTSLVLPWENADAETESIALFPSGNTLVGRAGPLFHSASEDAQGEPPYEDDTLPYGRLILERLR